MNVDAVLCTQALKKGRDVSIAFSDYGKAFDSVAHSWLIKVREMYKIHPTVPKSRVTACGHVEYHLACK